MGKPVVLDLETKRSFREVPNADHRLLGVSVVGTYSYETDRFRAYREEEFDELFQLLERSSLIIGFNSREFDLPVLQPYYVGRVDTFPQLDLLEEIKNSLGKRIALNEFATETLGVKKSGHGLMAITYFNEGRWDELINYCLDDVRITRDLYEYGKKNGVLYYKGPFGRREVRVNWNGREQNGTHLNLTLPM